MQSASISQTAAVAVLLLVDTIDRQQQHRVYVRVSVQRPDYRAGNLPEMGTRTHTDTHTHTHTHTQANTHPTHTCAEIHARALRRFVVTHTARTSRQQYVAVSRSALPFPSRSPLATCTDLFATAGARRRRGLASCRRAQPAAHGDGAAEGSPLDRPSGTCERHREGFGDLLIPLSLSLSLSLSYSHTHTHTHAHSHKVQR